MWETHCPINARDPKKWLVCSFLSCVNIFPVETKNWKKLEEITKEIFCYFCCYLKFKVNLKPPNKPPQFILHEKFYYDILKTIYECIVYVCVCVCDAQYVALCFADFNHNLFVLFTTQKSHGFITATNLPSSDPVCIFQAA